MSPVRMSAVLAVDAWGTAAETVEALRRQTIASALEVVLVGPDLDVPPGEAGPLATLRTVDSPIHPLSVARACGIAEARGDVVFVAETHGFPQPDCLERLLDVFSGSIVAAMPRLTNANPGSARSWASLLATYGGFTGHRSGPASYVALHNCAFERAFILRVARRPQDLIYGVGITDAIRRDGDKALFVADAIVEHLNVDVMHGVVIDRTVGGRLWAGLRSRSWSPVRRAVYAALFPAGAAVMTTRILRSEGWRDNRDSAPRGTAVLVAAWSLAQSLGEAQGYLAGVGECEERHLPIELHRRRYVR